MADFSSKKVLVTGAAGGIGAAITSRLRAAGARVAVADRDVANVAADATYRVTSGMPRTPMRCRGLQPKSSAGSTSSSTTLASSPADR